MDITEMLANLATDLKMTLDTEFTTTEGTRAITKAVDELSRHIPRERIYDHTWIQAVIDNTFTTPATEDPDYIVDAMDLPNTLVDRDIATLTATLWLDVPRPITFTLTDGDNSITRMTLIVKGTDAEGVYREERFYRHNGKVQTGKIYFSFIQEIEFNEIIGNVTGDTLDLGTAEPDLATGGIWVALSNSVEPGTELIYSGALKTGTKYTLNTDYEMDYANGRIRMKNGGTLADGTTYYANYNRASTSIDISSIIPELIRITKVLYPADSVPEQTVAMSVWKNQLTIGSPRQGVSQETLTDKEHVAIYYEARHAPPTLVSGGSYPELLDEVVLVGACGHVLLMEALQYEHAAVTDLASMRTELGYIGGATGILGVQALVIAALAKVPLYLETYNGDDNARTLLARITDEVVNLRTAINGAIAGADTIHGAISITTLTANVTAAGAALDKVTTYLANNGGDDAATILEGVTDDAVNLRTAINAAIGSGSDVFLGKVSSIDLDAATVGAVAWLLEGELLINRLNDGGPDVANKFADYARTKVQIGQARTQAALAYSQEASVRLANLRTYVEEASGWIRIAETFTGEASQRAAAGNLVAIGERVKIEQAAGYIAEANMRLDNLRTYIEESGAYNVIAETFVVEAQAQIGRIDRYLAEAAQYQEAAGINLILSDRYRAEAQSRLNEFRNVLASKSEYRKRIVSVPVKQPA